MGKVLGTILCKPRRNLQSGFTYLMLLWWVAIGGAALAVAGQTWTLEMARQREIEMVFRANQIRIALQRYHDATPGPNKEYPRSLAHLLEDTRSGQTLHHLRRPWRDPVTLGQDWGLVLLEGRIVGIYSQSAQKPVSAPKGVSNYKDWVFMAGANGFVNKPS